MSIFVLISGSWHGAWCWERVVPLLEAAEHRVIAPDLPSMGADKTPPAATSLTGWGRFVADILEAQPEPVILVGHSRGGIVISQAAEFAPDRIKRLIYLAAFLVADGKSPLETSQLVPSPNAPSPMILSEDGATSTIAPEAVGMTFYNTTETAWVKRAESLLGPEPMQGLMTPLRVSASRFGQVKRAYIECLRDNAVPIDLQRAMQATFPCDPVVAMDTDHSPFYSAPEELTHHLLAIAALDDGNAR